MIALGYTRRSKRSEEKTVSLQAQREHIERYCLAQGFDLAHVVEQDGMSGTKRARFATLDEAVKEFKASCVVVYNLDRLARDQAGLLDYLQTLRRRGIEIHETGAGRVDNVTALGRMVVGLRGGFDQYFAEIVGEKTADALRLKRQAGIRYTRIPPLGWRYELGRMIEEPEEQRALNILANCRRSGLGARRALTALQAEGYRGRQSLRAIHNALQKGGRK